MQSIEQRFARLSTDHAPGQEVRQDVSEHLAGPPSFPRLEGRPVDFSHGNVDEDAFAPTPGAFEAFSAGVQRGGSQAYTEYRGDGALRHDVARKLASFTGASLDAEREVIITPGTQGALFLALAATVSAGDKVAIVRPDYFANRKLAEFLGAEIVPVELDYLNESPGASLNLWQLETAFRAGAKTFVFSNPNNPTGVVYSAAEIRDIADLANRYGATVIVDQLYSRLVYPGVEYTHLRAAGIDANNVVSIMGPSKTESLSGYRLGVAFGAQHLVDRMERLQAIVSLRAPGYCQAVLSTWFSEPEGWMHNRIVRHMAIRDELVRIFRGVEGVRVRESQAGSYLFPKLPPLPITPHAFVTALRLEAGVTVTPGTEFSPVSTHSIRLNFSQNARAAADAAVRIGKMVERYRAS
jgi:aspartate/methionine/tyrosine aminotransferase